MAGVFASGYDMIADYLQIPGEPRPRKKELPRKVSEIVELVEDIERVVSNFSEKCARRDLPEMIKTLLTSRKTLSLLVADIEREISRAVGRPAKPRLPFDDILPLTKAITNSLESIHQELRPNGSERIPLTQLDQHVRQILHDYYYKTKSSREILEKISREIYPTNSESLNFEDLPSKVALLVNKQASTRDEFQIPRTPNSELTDSRDSIEAEGRMRWGISRINDLEASVEEYRRREEQMRNTARESNDRLMMAVGEAQELRTTLDAKQSEINNLRATELDLRQCRVSLKDAIEETKQLRATLDVKQGEILELKSMEQNLRETNAGAMRRAEIEKDTAIAETERRYGEEIETIKAKHAGDLVDQKTKFNLDSQAVEQQHKETMVTQRKKYIDDKRAMESQHHLEKANLRDRHSDELKEQRQYSENLRAKLDDEMHQHNLSQAGARKRTKEHEAQCIALEKRHAQNFAEQEELHLTALGRAEAEKGEQLALLRTEHNRQITESEETWKLKFAQAVRDHKAEESKLKESLRLEEARSIKSVEEEAQKHKNTIEKLKMQFQEVQGILLKQDAYSGLTDLEIVRGVTSKTGKITTVGFATMVSKVTTFSEWEWREDREIWSQETMTALVGTKQRRLKKLVLGDAIWTTLYQLVFCSPFRVLGKEGEHLEADWSGSFPSGDDEQRNEYKWPTPTVVSEKYRWETCEAALDSLTKQSSPYGPLRSSFVNHQAQFQERFLETVEAYVDLNEKREQDLLKFLTEVVRMWIVFCTQRYRIRIILPGSNESDPEKKSRLAVEQDDLQFTVVPRLQRHGNAKGAQLEEFSVISGNDGKVAAVHES